MKYKRKLPNYLLTTVTLAAAMWVVTLPLSAKATEISLVNMANWTVYSGLQTPEGLRIPESIEFLKDTPYYANPDDSPEEAEGVFAPQKVRVLKGEASWSVSSAVQWQIDTMYGPRWVRPYMWDIAITKPETIYLTGETPLYQNQNDQVESIASLSPQEVQIVNIEDKWFVGDSQIGKAWVQIHTTWLGDLWVHIPINRIGTVRPISQRAHYNNEPYYYEVGTALQDNDHTGTNELADGRLTNGVYEVIAELTTVYDRSYLVRSADGDKWVRGVGTIITDTNETLVLKVETPLFSDVWSTNNKELAVLKDVTVTAFETIQETFNGTWYHVRTSQGTTGWVNKRRAEPEDAIPVLWKIRLMGEKVPFRYPGVNFDVHMPNLPAQTVTALAYWDEPSGDKWVKIQTAEGNVWVRILFNDRIQDPKVMLQIAFNERNLGFATIIPQGHDLTLFGQQKIGYRSDDGTDFLSLVQLASVFRYQTKQDENNHTILLTKGDYKFELQAGQREAQIYWHNVHERTVQLLQPPIYSVGEWYLKLHDMISLFGLSQESWRNPDYFSLIEKDYIVEISDFPTKVGTDRKFELQAWLYEQWSMQKGNLRMPAMISIEEEGEASTSSLDAFQERVGSEEHVATVWYRLYASRTLTPGLHRLNAVLRVGERIVWKQGFSVEVPQ
ncbi:hypothetical protein ASG89_27745 [Paenibacillus sp. Soil766]|uniref:GW dipeptide domain-containing protein n=1 Tax=Paenibacillus sp. Soil766 TaxID=1736404 RepID=UPI000709D56C|nr:GW dipeptide domain-containing protein [Paenibacillus sp. Soil766]KRE99357.1 hypothetical protein ASG89_27745 [Paenibacillus sp. Soil766]